MDEAPYLDDQDLSGMTKEIQGIIAANVAELMQQRGWKQDELANRSGVAQKTISNIVRTGSTVTGKLAAIAYAFGLKPWMLMMPRAWDIQQPKKLSAMLKEYRECSRECQEQIERAAEKEAAFQRIKK